MKKNLLIISLIFAMFTAFSQEVQTVNENENPAETEQTAQDETPFCPHRINIHAGGAMTNNIYRRIPEITQNYSIGSMLEIQYDYFFNEHWGLGIGVGLNRIGAKAKFNFSGVVENWYDPAFMPEVYPIEGGREPYYDLYYSAKNFVEKQRVWAIEVPLQAKFEHKFGGKNGIYAALGVKGYFPINSYCKFPNEGEIITRGYEEFMDALYQDMPNHFGTYNYEGKSKKTKMRCSVDIQADFGGVFAMGRRTDFYLGAYCSYGFLDILPKAENKTNFVTRTDEHEFVFNGLMGSNVLDNYANIQKENGVAKPISTKWNLLQVGIKLGVHIKTCALPEEKSMKDLQREFYEEMMKKQQEPIVIKNTEYVYIVPVCQDVNEEGLTEEEQENIRELADALSNTKILFDLDKDIPKITDNNDNINRVVKIMKKDKSLRLIVEGYTCDLGSEEHNRDLAERRSQRIKQLFIDKGVPANQIETASYTYNDPENKRNIPDKSREEHRAAIFRINYDK